MMKTIDLLWFLTVVGLIYCEEGGVRLEVMAGSDVVLPCSLNNKDIGPAAFVWKKDDRQEVFLYDAGTHSNNGRHGQDEQFKGRVSHFPDELRHGNASIIIRNTRPSDSGSYTCYFPHIQQQRFHIELLVDPVLKPRPGIEGAAPEPSVTMLRQNKNSALLQCEVRGASPKPEVVWTESDGEILPADEPKITKTEGNKYDVVLSITVTKTDSYTCVATQKEIGHRVYSEAFVGFFICGNTGLIVGCWCLGLLSLVLAAVLIYQSWRFGYIRRCLMTERRDGDKNSDSPLLSVVRLEVRAGSDVVLPCSFNTKNDIEPTLFVWKKDGRQEVFLYDAGTHYNNGRPGQDEQFKGRVSHFPKELRHGNASIIIRNTGQSDSGSYTCYFPRIQQRFHIELLVAERHTCDKLCRMDGCPEGGVRLEVRAGSDVVLPCYLNNENIEPALFDWMKDGRQDVFLYDDGTHDNNSCPGEDEQFKGRVSHFPDELINGNASIIIRNTQQSDSGSYTCDFPHIQQKRFHIELLVGTHDSGMDSGSSYDPEQPLDTEEDTEPGVAPVEPDEAVTVHLQESTE